MSKEYIKTSKYNISLIVSGSFSKNENIKKYIYWRTNLDVSGITYRLGFMDGKIYKYD